MTGDDATSEPELDEVERAADSRIVAEALRQLEEIEPGESDDWRLDSSGSSVCPETGS